MLVRYAGRYRPAQVRFRLADPSHALSASSSNFVFKRPNFGFRQTDGQTDRRTDGRTDGRTELGSKVFVLAAFLLVRGPLQVVL